MAQINVTMIVRQRARLVPLLGALLMLLIGCGSPANVARSPGKTTVVPPQKTVVANTQLVVQVFQLPTTIRSVGKIIAGPDGNLWFPDTPPAMGKTMRLGYITPGGIITEHPLQSSIVIPTGIVSAADGTLWITGNGANGDHGELVRVTLPAA
ncbi:hypothetical protein [Dictyobacter kobayashii]|uniref:Uncharacterized protein n=1 Tax=Dictyobacter kobayashii TaxID=2014872 RepID=A0A402ARC9_9CHLR|nr:hypothetical protein [Dictyobacter kobayashii]GCE21652.1 hypothetical protein KDK_54520 [Dictyobacter kobayashii]